MSIYVKFAIPTTVRAFLEKFFTEDASWNGACAVRTYRDQECTKLQCYEQKNRSIQDMLECVNTYFPGTEVKTLVEELVMLRPQGRIFTPYRCCTIGRPVVQYSPSWSYMVINFKIPKTSKAKYSWGRILREELGITTTEQLIAYKAS